MKKVFRIYWPIFVLVFIWFIFAQPYFLKGLVPFPSTYLAESFPHWNSYSPYEGPVKNAATPDVISQIYPWKTLVIESWKNGQIPFWNPYSFSGTPLLANYQSAALSPINFLYFILPFINAWSVQILLQPLLAGIFMFLFARSIKLGNSASLISSTSFAFCGFITVWMSYGTLAYAILFLPLALFSIEKYFQTKKWIYIPLISIVIPLSFFSGHFQTSIYFLLFAFSYIGFKFLVTRQFKEAFFTLLSVFSGIMLSAPQLLPSIEFYIQSVRSDLFMKNEVIPWGYLPTFIAPDFFGNPVTRNDWFGHYAEWNFYIGVIPLMLAVYSLFRRNVYIIFFLLAIITTLFLAFQTPLLDLMIMLKIPVLSTSAASRIIVLASFSAAILAGFGFENFLSDIRKQKVKHIYIWLAFFAFVIGALWIVGLHNILIPGDKGAIALSNMRLPTAIFAFFTFLIIVCIFVKKRLLVILLTVAVVLLSTLDVLRFSVKWQPFEPGDLMYQSTALSEFLEKTIEPFDRGLGNYGAEAAIDLKFSTMEGYDPLYITSYGVFLDAVGDGRYGSPSRSVVSFPKHGIYASDTLNLLGVRYIVHKIADSNASWTFPVWEYDVNHFVMVFEDDYYQVFENHRVFPRAYVAEEYEVVTDMRKSIKTIFNEDNNLRKRIILEKDIDGGLATGSASIIDYSPNNIKVRVETDGEALLFLSDPYYPGWKAFVNGEESEVLKANYSFRAVEVPDGNSEVLFSYEPASFRNGLVFAAIGFVIIMVISFYVAKRGYGSRN